MKHKGFQTQVQSVNTDLTMLQRVIVELMMSLDVYIC